MSDPLLRHIGKLFTENAALREAVTQTADQVRELQVQLEDAKQEIERLRDGVIPTGSVAW